MDSRTVRTITCRQCRKDIKTEVHRCVQCDKQFHPSCIIRLHKVYNQNNKLIPCKGKTKVLVIAGGSDCRETNMSSSEAQISDSIMENKVEAIYKLVKEIQDKMIGKTFLKRAILEVVEKEMDRIKIEIQTWKAELKQIINSTIKKEIKKLVDIIPIVETNKQKTDNTKSYSKAVVNKQEAIISIKPVEESEANSSEMTKKDIKKTIDVSKLGVGITKMKKASGGAIVVGCEDKK